MEGAYTFKIRDSPIIFELVTIQKAQSSAKEVKDTGKYFSWPQPLF